MTALVEFGPLADVLYPAFPKSSPTVNGQSARPKVASIPREMRPALRLAGATCRPGAPDLVPVQDPGDEAMALMFIKTAMKSLPAGHPALKHLVGAALSLPSPEPTLGGAA